MRACACVRASVCVRECVPVRIPMTLRILAAPLSLRTLGDPPIGGEGRLVWGAPVGLGWAGWQGGSLLGGDHFRRPAGGRRSPLRWAAGPRLRLPRALGSGARRWGWGGRKLPEQIRPGSVLRPDGAGTQLVPPPHPLPPGEEPRWGAGAGPTQGSSGGWGALLPRLGTSDK